MLDDISAPGTETPTRRSLSRWLPAAVVVLAIVVTPLVAPDGSTEAGPSDETLRAGAEVYSTACSACHQPGGAGLPGSFPPLADNPNVDDAAYIEDVIMNGLSGEITVNGEVFDSVMPSQSTLSDGDVAALIAYIQSGFVAPATEVAVGPVADDSSGVSGSTIMLVFAVVFGLGLVVMGRRVVAVNDRREITWVDAWMKTSVIVVFAVVGTVIVPAKVIELNAVQDLSRTAQDLLIVGIWSVAVGALLLALWFAHRERRI